MFSTLISAQELAHIKDQTKLVIVDCRHDLIDAAAGKNAYDAGHIAGAVFANLDQDLSGPKVGSDGKFRGRHPLPQTDNLISALRRFGIDHDSQVVAYDAHGGMFAARLWWLLRSIGHQAVAVLDGGVAAWTALGNALQTVSQQPALGSIEVRAALTRQVDVSEVFKNLSSGADQGFQVVDARAADRFCGENETIDPVGGHIPGAVNRFFKDNLDANGLFKLPQQLREEWLSKIRDPQSAVMQCGSGVTACHNLLALEVAGLSGAALYPGSWSEWCADASRPVATGPN